MKKMKRRKDYGKAAVRKFDFNILINYPAASNGLSTGIFIIAPRGGELTPCPPQAD